MAAITIILLCAQCLNHSFARTAFPRELVVVPVTLLLFYNFPFFIYYFHVRKPVLHTHNEQKGINFSICLCVCVCLSACWDSQQVVMRLPGLFRPHWKIVRIITGFMEVYFAVMCSEKYYLMERKVLQWYVCSNTQASFKHHG